MGNRSSPHHAPQGSESMALAEAIPGGHPIRIATLWAVFVPFYSVFAPFRIDFAPFCAVADRSESFLDRVERRTLRKVCENLRKICKKSAKIRKSLVSHILSGLLTLDANARWTLQNVSESPWLACRVSAEQSLPKMC